VANDEALDKLRSVDVFRGLSDKQLRGVVERGRVIDHPDGHVITEEGGSAVGFHLVLDGTATVQLGGQDVRVLKPGEYFGEISLIDGQPRSASVVAGEGLRTFALVTWEFRPLLEEQPQIALELLNALCGRLREAEARGVH
jgi:CRP/FNR family transcriptional regulator, cyclic AMP receptor protein